MTEFESTLIDNTQNLIGDLMKNLSSIESVEIIKEFVAQGEVVIMLPDGSIKKLAVLPEEGLAVIKQHITQQLDYELSESLTKLKYLTDAHSNYAVAESLPEASESVTEVYDDVPVPDDSEVYEDLPTKKSKAADIDINEVLKLRKKGWSLKRISAKYGVCEQTILNRINKAEKQKERAC